jgi:hypothetical protein
LTWWEGLCLFDVKKADQRQSETNTDDRPDLTPEGAPDIDKTVNVKQKLIFGHEPQMGLDTKTD